MGEQFDRLVKYRSHFPEGLRKYIRMARLFCFDMLPTETSTSSEWEQWGKYSPDFTLPFPVTAIEDRVSCVIMYDLEPNVIGLSQTRGVLEAVSMRALLQPGAFAGSLPELPFDEHKKMEAAYSEFDATAVRWGTIQVDWDAGINKWVGTSDSRFHVEGTLMVDERKDVPPIDAVALCPEAANRDFERAGITAYEELLRLSEPSTFLLERLPKKTTSSKYRKSFERPNYTVLHPGAIRQLLKLPTPEPDKDEKGRVILERRAHWRSEHTRTLRSERYGDRRGEVLEIPRSYVSAFWKGPSEATIGGHHYRVILG